MTRERILGKNDKENLVAHNDLIKQLVESRRPSALLYVASADKRKIPKGAVRRIYGADPDKDPKTGKYYSVCIDLGLAKFLAVMIAAREFEGDIDYHGVVAVLDSSAPCGGIPFHEYGLHDFRRLSITLKALAWRDLFEVARTHGQKHLSTVSRYYQWGLEQIERRAVGDFEPIE